MVVDITIQTEINKKELKLYPFRHREFHPNLNVRPITGKFYARHDYADPSFYDESIEKAILRHQVVLPADKFKEPVTTSMEYGWYSQTSDVATRGKFFYPRYGCWITKIGGLIAIEDQKNPKKPFTGVAFKV